MEWAVWRPTYELILDDFRFDRAADERARDLLDELLAPKLRADTAALREHIRGRETYLVGAAATRHDVRRIPADAPTLVTDGAAHVAVPERAPTAIVTDLDGDIIVQAAANAIGVPLFVHAHGDNAETLRTHVPHLVGPLVGTTQAQPRGHVHNYGGFTDGDRAACIAAAMGAHALALVGYDFDAPVTKHGSDADAKRRKLAWARRIIHGLGLNVRHA